MHPYLISHIAQQAIAERIRNVELERRARLARLDRGPSVTDRLVRALGRWLAGWQPPGADRLAPARGGTAADDPRP